MPPRLHAARPERSVDGGWSGQMQDSAGSSPACSGTPKLAVFPTKVVLTARSLLYRASSAPPNRPAVFCAAPSLIELEALGVPVNAQVWPPQAVPGAAFDLAAANLEPAALLASPRFAASVDVVRQFAADSSEPVIAVALTGPATLEAQLRSLNAAGDDETLYEFIGRLLAVMLRMYAEAGAQLIQLHEAQLPSEAEEHWKGALGTAGNVARFHRIPPLLVYSEDIVAPLWPMQAVPAIAADKPPPRAHAHAWTSDPARWESLPNGQKNERVVTTSTEVPADFPLAELLGHVKRVLAAPA